MREHPLDRAMRAARPAILVFVVVSGPVFLFSYGWAMKLLLMQVGLWWGAIFVVCHVMAGIAVGSLFDSRQERAQTSPDGQA